MEETLIEQLTDCAKELKANPVYAVSLGSRELFHSNFLEWFLNTFPTGLARVLGEDSAKYPMGSFKVEREKANIDLVIEVRRKGSNELQEVIAIENKVKDTPKLEQLLDYDAWLAKTYDAQNCNIRKVILSLVRPQKEIRVRSEWRWLTYSELGSGVEAALLDSGSEVETEISAIVRCYVKMVKSLVELVELVNRSDSRSRDYWFSRSYPPSTEETAVDANLDSIRFADTIQKHRADALLLAVRKATKNSDWLKNLGEAPQKELEKERPTPGQEEAILVCSSAEFTNKRPLVVMKVSRPVRGMRLFLGVQVQGSQYRRLIEWRGFTFNKSDEERSGKIDEFLEMTDNYKWLFGRDNTGGGFTSVAVGFFREFEGKVSSRSRPGKPICTYAPHFIYQHVDVGSGEAGSALPPSQIVEAIIADLEAACKLLRDDTYIQRFANYGKMP